MMRKIVAIGVVLIVGVALLMILRLRDTAHDQKQKRGFRDTDVPPVNQGQDAHDEKPHSRPKAVERPHNVEKQPSSSQDVDVASPKIDSAESALRIAEGFLNKQEIDLSRWDMSKAGTVQRMMFKGSPAWRVEWTLKNVGSSEGMFTKGGELLVLVTDEGQCQLAMGR